MVEKENLPYPVSIVLFTRYPDPGKVKTRLAWDNGDRTAANIHGVFMSKMLMILLREINGVNIIVNYTGIDYQTEMIQGFDPALVLDIKQGINSGVLSFIKQPSTSFGERINAIAQQLKEVIIIGADIPGITADILSQAIECVKRKEAAIALTKDNGYYLIALPSYSDVFTSINYSLGNVGQQTYTLMKKNYNSASILNQSLVDVDEISDLKSLGLSNLIEENQPIISVIIPTLNEVNSIYDTLANIVKQAETSNNIEILVVDGGSNDNTLERVEEFTNDYPNISIQSCTISSLGRAFQMNVGLRHSSGKYLVFCHADTLLPSEWDHKLISILSHKNIKLAYFDLQFNSDHLALKWVAWTVNYIRRSPYGDQVFCVRRDYFKEIGGFDYLSLLEDVTLFENKINYKQCQNISHAIITNARKYSNKNGEYTCLSIFKNVGKNWLIMAGKKILKLPACQLRKIHHGSQNEYQLLEIPFQDKFYTFKYHFPNNILHKFLIWKKIYYQQSMDELIPVIFKYCQGDDIFIDVGAKVGMVSCLLSIMLTKNRIKTDIISFEPDYSHYQLFKDNYKFYLGEIRNKITIENIYISNPKSYYYPDLKEKSLKSMALDEYEFPNNKKISLIKINLEGNELGILKGMVKTIKQHQPVLIFHNSTPFITHFLDKKHDMNNIIEKLNDLNYQVTRFSGLSFIAVSDNI